MACEPETDLESAGQFSSIIPPGLHAAVQSYLLAKIRGGSMDVNEIMQEAKCYSQCIPPGLMPRIKTWLLCQLSNTGGETPIPVVECVPDSDAQAFITAAGLTDATQISAICQLVSDLKTYPAVGTKYWDRETLIYPFVGGNAVSHSFNLKNPAGPNNLAFLGGGFTHSAFGVQGNGAASYATTSYLIPSLNSFRTMWYIDVHQTTIGRCYFGCSGPIPSHWFCRTAAAIAFNFACNENSASNFAGSPMFGASFQQRITAATKQAVNGIAAWTSFAINSTIIPDRHMMLFAINSGGVAPIGAPSLFSNARISSFSFGTPLDPTGIGNTEHLEYKGIWDRFNTRLGRGHP